MVRAQYIEDYYENPEPERKYVNHRCDPPFFDFRLYKRHRDTDCKQEKPKAGTYTRISGFSMYP